jgi:Flp pilus assembly protein TadG
MKLKKRLRGFAGARQGLAGIEFALIAPMMVFTLFGSIEILDLLDANRRLENAAASLADVTARDTEISNQDLAGLWAALDVLMFPDTGDPVQIRLTSVTVDSATVARVVWSEGHGMTARTTNSTVSLPSGMMKVGTNLIMAEAEYQYGGSIGFVLQGPMTLGHNVYRRSRLVDPIPRVT